MIREETISWRRTGRVAPDERLGKSGRAGARRPPVSVGEQLRIDRGVPQAVLRVLSYRHGAAAVRQTAAYVTAKSGERFVIEGDIEVDGAGERCAIVAEWAADFGSHSRARDAAHFELSAPPGSDRAKLFAAVRAFANETFGATHRYILAEHRDTAHPHAHLIVKLRGYDGRQLDPRKGDLACWRERFAACARAEGLELGASPRSARGVTRKGVSRAAVEQRRRETALAAHDGARSRWSEIRATPARQPSGESEIDIER